MDDSRKVIPVNFNHAETANEATLSFDLALVDAINGALASGVAPGIIIAILQGRLHIEVAKMCNSTKE